LIIQLFRTNRPVVFVLLLLYTVLLRGAFLYHPAWVAPEKDMFPGENIFSWISGQHIPLLYLVIADIVLVYAEAILLNLTLTAYNIFERNSYVPALMFITISSLFGEWMAADFQTIGQFFVLLSMLNLFSLSGKELSRENVFYTSLYLSIGSFFYFPVSVFLIIIFAGLLIRSYALLDFLLLIAGFVLPYYFTGIVMYYTGELPQYLHSLQKLIQVRPFEQLHVSAAQFGLLLYVLLLIFFGYILFRQDREFKIIKQRRLVYLMLGYAIITVLTAPAITGNRLIFMESLDKSVVTSNSLIYLQMLAMPAAIFTSKVFNRDRLRFYHHILFLLLLAGVVFFNLYFLNII
jgi:hypothetical protein